MTTGFDLGVRCAHFLSMAGGRAEPERDVFLGIRAGRIAEVGPWTNEKQAQSKEYLDLSRHVVLPGLVNAHTHLAMTLFRGLQDDVSFHTWLFDRILPLEAKLVDPQFVRVGTELAMLESIRFGVTCVSDMYFFTETIADVIDRAGARGWVAQAIADHPLPEDAILGRDKAAVFAKFHERYGKHDRIVPALGPHAPYSCSDATLKQTVQLSEKYLAPIHIHLAETRKEVEDSLKSHGKTPAKRLHDLGVLGPRTLCAHCVHLNDEDIALMKDSGSSIVHNPDSNLKLSSGLAPITKYRKQGIPVAWGTDGAASNNDLSVFGAMDLGTKLQKQISGDTTAMVASDALSCATWEGAKALGLESRIGSLEVGKDADFIAVDLDHPHLQPVHDVRSLLVYATSGLEVDTVACQGRLLMRDKVVLSVDRDRVMREARELGAKIERAAKAL